MVTWTCGSLAAAGGSARRSATRAGARPPRRVDAAGARRGRGDRLGATVAVPARRITACSARALGAASRATRWRLRSRSTAVAPSASRRDSPAHDPVAARPAPDPARCLRAARRATGRRDSSPRVTARTRRRRLAGGSARAAAESPLRGPAVAGRRTRGADGTSCGGAGSLDGATCRRHLSDRCRVARRLGRAPSAPASIVARRRRCRRSQRLLGEGPRRLEPRRPARRPRRCRAARVARACPGHRSSSEPQAPGRRARRAGLIARMSVLASSRRRARARARRRADRRARAIDLAPQEARRGRDSAQPWPHAGQSARARSSATGRLASRCRSHRRGGGSSPPAARRLRAARHARSAQRARRAPRPRRRPRPRARDVGGAGSGPSAASSPTRDGRAAPTPRGRGGRLIGASNDSSSRSPHAGHARRPRSAGRTAARRSSSNRASRSPTGSVGQTRSTLASGSRRAAASGRARADAAPRRAPTTSSRRASRRGAHGAVTWTRYAAGSVNDGSLGSATS